MLWGKKTIEVVGYSPEEEDDNSSGPYRGTVEVPGAWDTQPVAKSLAADMYDIAVVAQIELAAAEAAATRERIAKTKLEILPAVLVRIKRKAEQGETSGYLSALACSFPAETYSLTTLIDGLAEQGFEIQRTEKVVKDYGAVGIKVSWDFSGG
jgi:hypothetical protein